MALSSIVASLLQEYEHLQSGFAVEWHIPPAVLPDPLAGSTAAEWPVWDGRSQPFLQKNAPNWLYAAVTFPETWQGIPLAGEEALLSIRGLSPFTLWLNGEQLYAETHAWHATGPIADPLPIPITPGQSLQLILCLEPTELPAGAELFVATVRPTRAVQWSYDLSAAAGQLQLAEKLAEGPEEQACVARAVDAIDTVALSAQRWDAVLASIAEMERHLLPLSPRAKALTVHLLGHAHIDMDWMWTWADTVSCIRRDFKAVTDLMDDHPGVTFIASQIPTYAVVRDLDPEVFARVRQRVAEGRWVNGASTWVEGDLNMADGEAIVRQIQYAIDWTRAELGTAPTVFWEPDTFGHPGNMPQIARLAECDCYFHMRGGPGTEFQVFYQWEGVDGTTIPVFSCLYSTMLEPHWVIYSLLTRDLTRATHCLRMWGIGDHGGGLPRFELAQVERYRDKPLIPTFTFSTIDTVLPLFSAEMVERPHVRGALQDSFDGCFTTHSALKYANRACETALLDAETLCALTGLDASARLREAWLPALFNQFHDIFDGAAVHDTYLDAGARAATVLAEAQAVHDAALSRLTPHADADGRWLIVTNTLGQWRTEPVRALLPDDVAYLVDDMEIPIPVQRLKDASLFIAADVPPFGQKSYRIVTHDEAAAPAFPAISIGNGVNAASDSAFISIETATARVKIQQRSGVIASYFDTRLQRELVPAYQAAHPGVRDDLGWNVFQLIDETPIEGSAWTIGASTREETLLRAAEVCVLEAGPVFARCRVRHSVRESSISEELLFYRDLPRIDVHLQLDWHERGNAQVGVPQLKFAATNWQNVTQVRADGPFLVQDRMADGLEHPMQKMVDVSGADFGLTVCNDGRYGYDALGGRLRITLLRNAYEPDVETDNGVHHLRLALLPHAAGASNAQLLHDGLAFNHPLCVTRAHAAHAATAWPLHID